MVALPWRKEDKPASRIIPGPFDEAEVYARTFPPDFTKVIFDNAEAQMEAQERLALYTLTFCLQPRHVLEVGVCNGGSSRILVRALDDAGRGRLYSIDPQPQVAPELLHALQHRMTLKTGFSPDGIAELRALAGAGFDLAFIDGDHSFDGVVRDIRGVLEYLADTAYLLFHDAYYAEVRAAIDACIKENPRQLQDCGIICRTSVWEADKAARWGGLRLVAYSRNGFAG